MAVVNAQISLLLVMSYLPGVVYAWKRCMELSVSAGSVAMEVMWSTCSPGSLVILNVPQAVIVSAG